MTQYKYGIFSFQGEFKFNVVSTFNINDDSKFTKLNWFNFDKKFLRHAVISLYINGKNF